MQCLRHDSNGICHTHRPSNNAFFKQIYHNVMQKIIDQLM